MKLCLVTPICKILIGKDHKFIHRAVLGTIIMSCGVILARIVGHHEVQAIAILGDTIGYGLHGVGLIPFVEKVLLMEV